METIYNVDYFIKKFQGIPEDKWTTRQYTDGSGRRCAAGWCGHHKTMAGYTSEGMALIKLLSPIYIADVNDGFCDSYQQPTPKQRILAALYDIKKAQQPEVKERIVYVTVDEPVRELQKKEFCDN